MKLTIKEINTVHYIKGKCEEGQLKEIKCYILEKLQKGNSVMVNLDHLEDTSHKVIYMIQRLKKVLTNRKQLQYSKCAV
ncbi:hypothetical protein [uncultured Dokdonia sp.]|uniref:hypothetical protein n=1 Tax=uncultured Dokdonia sp. TaxID=575653 RepID=UPI00261BDF7A|nr:hypothetical protein [uncultured Dokdonia sp.]